MPPQSKEEYQQDVLQLPRMQAQISKKDEIFSLPPPSVVFKRNTSTGRLFAVPKIDSQGEYGQDFLDYIVEGMDQDSLEVEPNYEPQDNVLPDDQPTRLDMFSALSAAASTACQKEQQYSQDYQRAEKDTASCVSTARRRPSVHNRERTADLMERWSEVLMRHNCTQEWQIAVQDTAIKLFRHIQATQTPEHLRENWQAYSYTLDVVQNCFPDEDQVESLKEALKLSNAQMQAKPSDLLSLPGESYKVDLLFRYKAESSGPLHAIPTSLSQAAPGLPFYPIEHDQDIDWPPQDTKAELNLAPFPHELVDIKSASMDSHMKLQPYIEALNQECGQIQKISERLAVFIAQQGATDLKGVAYLQSTVNGYRKAMAEKVFSVGEQFLDRHGAEALGMMEAKSKEMTNTEKKAYKAFIEHESSLASRDMSHFSEISHQFIEYIGDGRAARYGQHSEMYKQRSTDMSTDSKTSWECAGLLAEAKKQLRPSSVGEIWKRIEKPRPAVISSQPEASEPALTEKKKKKKKKKKKEKKAIPLQDNVADPGMMSFQGQKSSTMIPQSTTRESQALSETQTIPTASGKQLESSDEAELEIDMQPQSIPEIVTPGRSGEKLNAERNTPSATSESDVSDDISETSHGSVDQLEGSTSEEDQGEASPESSMSEFPLGERKLRKYQEQAAALHNQEKLSVPSTRVSKRRHTKRRRRKTNDSSADEGITSNAVETAPTFMRSVPLTRGKDDQPEYVSSEVESDITGSTQHDSDGKEEEHEEEQYDHRELANPFKEFFKTHSRRTQVGTSKEEPAHGTLPDQEGKPRRRWSHSKAALDKMAEEWGGASLE